MRLSEVAKHLAVTATSDAVTSLVDKELVQKTRSPQMDDDRHHVNHSGQQTPTQTASWSLSCY